MIRGRLALVLVLAVGCTSERPPCAPGVWLNHVAAPPGTPEVDLLLMVDNSGAMSGEQALFGMELPSLIRAIVTGDLDGDGIAEARPATSLHVGVVTSDMGAGPSPLPGPDGVVPSCDPGLGDDGILRSVSTTRFGCSPRHPPVFEFEAGDNPDLFAADVACVALTGSGGCGFEQQLESMLKAIAPASATASYLPDGYANEDAIDAIDLRPPIFAGDTRGHGDGLNAGFVRRDSVLAIVLLTDEEDCSVSDYSIFYRDPRFMTVGLNLRCFTYPDRLYPTDRYVENLIHLRDDPERLVFAVIAGVPTDLVGDDEWTYTNILADSRMIETPDPAPTPPTRLLSSCSTADGGEAFAPRRMVEVARGLAERGARTTVRSVCAATFVPAIHRIAELITGAYRSGCAARAIPVGEDGTVDCELVEVLSAESDLADCTTLGGATFDGRDAVDARVRCLVHQLTPSEVALGPDAPPGWFYDESPEAALACTRWGGRRISYSPAHHVPPLTEIRLTCSEGAPPDAGGCDPWRW